MFEFDVRSAKPHPMPLTPRCVYAAREEMRAGGRTDDRSRETALGAALADVVRSRLSR